MKKMFLIFIVLTTSNSFALINDTIVGGCDTHTQSFIPVFQIKTYTCNAGYFLPANTDGCRPCPQYHYCSGGTYNFNALESQGIIISCDAGYFVPANTDGCRPCPTGYTCDGGMFNVNPIQAQGITPKIIMSASTQYTCSANMTFTAGNIAVWHPIFQPNTVTVTWDDGNGHTTTSTCTYGDIITLPPAPTRAGYTFNGWTVKTE